MSRQRELVLLATVFGIVGAVLYVASNPALGMLAVSDQYGAATTDAARASACAAAQATLAALHGTAFHARYLIGSLALIVISVPMIRSQRFGLGLTHMGASWPAVPRVAPSRPRSPRSPSARTAPAARRRYRGT